MESMHFCVKNNTAILRNIEEEEVEEEKKGRGTSDLSVF